MPLDYGCWFDQHHGVEDLRPNLVKPHPEEPVCAEQPRATWSLPPQDGHLMSQGDEFKLQGGAAANTEREQGNECGKNCDHAHDGMAVARKSLAFLNFLSFEQPQAASPTRAKVPVNWVRGRIRRRVPPSGPLLTRSITTTFGLRFSGHSASGDVPNAAACARSASR